MSEPLPPTEQDRLVRYCLQEATHHRDNALAAPVGSTLALIEQHTATAYVIVATLGITPEPRDYVAREAQTVLSIRSTITAFADRLDGIAEAFAASAVSHCSEGVAHSDLLESCLSDLREWIDQ